jgi:hypothetical protein
MKKKTERAARPIEDFLQQTSKGVTGKLIRARPFEENST